MADQFKRAFPVDPPCPIHAQKCTIMVGGCRASPRFKNAA